MVRMAQTQTRGVADCYWLHPPEDKISSKDVHDRLVNKFSRLKLVFECWRLTHFCSQPQVAFRRTAILRNFA